MKRNLLLLLIGLCLFTFTGCSTSPINSEDTSSHPASSHTTQDEVLSSVIPPADFDVSLNTPTASVSSAIEIAATPTDNIIGYPGNTIRVNSSEKVTVIPDIAEVVYSVRTENKEAAVCQQNNNDAVTQVIQLLMNLGIKETSIQTSDYYMHPIYSYKNNTTKVVGYEATSTLTVTDLPIDDLDDILAQSVTSGINTVQSITYRAGKYDECYHEALSAAINSAYQKAETMAMAAGCHIGHVISIEETSGYSEARYADYARVGQLNAAKEEALADSAKSIMPGEIEVEASIVVEYQLVYSK